LGKAIKKNVRIDFKKLAKKALHHSQEIVTLMLPNGKQEGREWVAKNPLRNDQNLGSFKVNLSTGKWADFASDAKGGDLISLVAYIKQCRQVEAARMIINILGGQHD
jgi:hypothetical protein